MQASRPRIALRVPGREVIIGEVPRVVGTLSALGQDFTATDAGCDIVEVRLDQMPSGIIWLPLCQSIEANGLPVILTIRLESEGGKWAGSDEERLDVFQKGLEHLAAVDVEFRSKIASPIAERARRLKKVCIVSFHDFERTPDLEELRDVTAKAQKAASVVKITTMTKSNADVETLRKLLATKWEVPLCVMGMGELGSKTRISLAAHGSCLIYGYLDKPMAPGQLPVSNLVQQLRDFLPACRNDVISRKPVK